MLAGRAKEQMRRGYANDLTSEYPEMVGQLDVSRGFDKIKDVRLRLRLCGGRNEHHLNCFKAWLEKCCGRVIAHLDRDDPIGTFIEMRSDARSDTTRPPFYVDFNEFSDPIDNGNIRKNMYDLEIDLHNNRVGRAIQEM